MDGKCTDFFSPILKQNIEGFFFRKKKFLINQMIFLGFEFYMVCRIIKVCVRCFKMELFIKCSFLNDVIEIDTWKITRMKLNISPAVTRDSEFVCGLTVEIKTFLLAWLC